MTLAVDWTTKDRYLVTYTRYNGRIIMSPFFSFFFFSFFVILFTYTRYNGQIIMSPFFFFSSFFSFLSTFLLFYLRIPGIMVR